MLLWNSRNGNSFFGMRYLFRENFRKFQKSFRMSSDFPPISIESLYWYLNFCRWRCRFQTSAHGIAMAIPWAEVRNGHLHRQKFRPYMYDISIAVLFQIFISLCTRISGFFIDNRPPTILNRGPFNPKIKFVLRSFI